MSLIIPEHIEERHNHVDVNQELLELKGELTDDEAKIALIKYLRANLGITVRLICGIELYPLQEILLKAMFNNNYSMLVMGRGAGKCQVYEHQSLVLTKENGLIPLTSLFKNLHFKSEEYVKKINPIHIWNGQSFQKVSEILVQNDKECVDLTSHTGYKISGSNNHLIKIFDPETFRISWKRLGEFNGDEFVCIKRDIVEDWQDTGKKNRVSKKFRQCAEFFKKNDLKAFHEEYEMRSKGSIRYFLIGVCDKVAIRSSTRIYLTVYSNSDEDKVRYIQTCLSLFGVKSSIIKNAGQYHLSVLGTNMTKFYNQIGKYTERKKLIQNSIYRKKTLGERMIIPRAFEKLMELADFSRLDEHTKERLSEIEQREKLLGKSISEINISYECFKYYLKVFEKAHIDIPFRYKEIIDENFLFDKVRSLEKRTAKCIDFCDIPSGAAYWSNGFINHNSFLSAVFCILVCIFEPRTKVIIAGPNFRTARLIFETIESICERPEASLLRACYIKENRKGGNDQLKWKINGGSITAIPLSGEKIRGFRANVLLCDEYLRLPEHVVKDILMPFLVVPQNTDERNKIVREEDELIKKGLLAEEDRTEFKNTARMIALSSASYTFENLYATYADWNKKILDPRVKPEYFTAQVSYEAIPKHLVDHSVIDEAKNGGASSASFLREYCAQFTDGSDSYYSPKKMHLCTIQDGDTPTVKIKGDPNKRYVLGIDPSFSEDPTSDFFAMSILEVSDDLNTGTLVHTYAVAGGSPKDHVDYLYYVWTEFRPSLIVVDNAGWEFIDHANNSKIFSDNGQCIKSFQIDSLAEGIDYDAMINEAKRKYDPSDSVVYFKQYFHSDFIRKANQELQICIDSKRIFFGASAAANPSEFRKMIDQFSDPEFSLKKFPKPIPKAKKVESIGDFIEYQGDLVVQTKAQCALIEVKSSPKGIQSFDLPNNLKTKSESRARKDNYTTLLLANWGLKILRDIEKHEEKTVDSGFTPFSI